MVFLLWKVMNMTHWINLHALNLGKIRTIIRPPVECCFVKFYNLQFFIKVILYRIESDLYYPNLCIIWTCICTCLLSLKQCKLITNTLLIVWPPRISKAIVFSHSQMDFVLSFKFLLPKFPLANVSAFFSCAFQLSTCPGMYHCFTSRICYISELHPTEKWIPWSVSTHAASRSIFLKENNNTEL